MDIEIKNKTDNPLLSRTEVEARVSFEGVTPSRKDVQKELAKALKAKEDLVLITHVNTSFGEASASLFAHVYKNAETMSKLERKNLIEKHLGHEPKAEEGAEE